MITGSATIQGTKKFADNRENFNNVNGLYLSNVGLGTYLGDSDSKTDELVRQSIHRSINAGINVIDTAINYRGQRAERTIGRALNEMIQEGKISRDQIFISTKNGYVTNDADVPGDFWQYINKEYVQRGIIKEGDITSGYHCMTVRYLDDQLNKSLKNLDMDCIDLLYIHNAVEGQIGDITMDEFLENLKAVFELYERKRKEGVIKNYGMATWECFRVSADKKNFLSLEKIVRIAQQIGGDDHGFKFVQLPFNMHYDQAFMIKNQPINNNQVSFLQAAQHLGIGVFTSIPLMQGRLLQPGVMPEFIDLDPPLRALQFIRSTPGVLAPLVGQKTKEHLDENLKIMEIPPISETEFKSIIQKIIT